MGGLSDTPWADGPANFRPGLVVLAIDLYFSRLTFVRPVFLPQLFFYRPGAIFYSTPSLFFWPWWGRKKYSISRELYCFRPGFPRPYFSLATRLPGLVGT